MANNGYLTSGVCEPSPAKLLAQMCQTSFPTSFYSAHFVDVSGAVRTTTSNVFCYTSSLGSAGSFKYAFVPNCEIPGPPLTETEQIQAINQFLPYALAFLAVIWGARKVYDVLWSGASRRPASSGHE